MNAYIQAKQNQAKLTAINERAAEVAKEMVDIELDLTRVRAQSIDPAFRAAMATGDITTETAALLVKEEELQTQYREREGVLTSLTELAVETSSKITESEIAQGTAISDTTNIMLAAYAKQEELVAQRKAADDAATDAMILNANELGLTLDEYVEQEKKRVQEEEEALKKREATLASYVDAATNMFGRIDTKSDTSVSKMISNLNANAKAMEEWATNVAKLIEKGLNPDMINKLIEEGPEAAAGRVAALAAATPKEVEKINTAYESAGTAAETSAAAVETAQAGLATSATAATTSATELTTATTEATTAIGETQTAVETLDTTLVTATESVNTWVTDMGAVATTSVPEIVDSIILKYTTLPTSINTSYALVLTMTQEWVNNMISTANREMPRFVTAVVNTVQQLVDKMRTLGAQTARGWGEGFNSETGWVYAQIKAFIDRIVADVKTGLDIHSPSGVSEEIGVSFAQGFVVGIQKMAGAIADTVSNVFNPEVSMMGFETGNVSMGSLSYAGGMSDGEIQTGGFQLIQNIQSVPQTPTELAATTALYFDRARWVKG